MWELLSVICGGAFRLAPSILDLWHKRADNEHELAMVDKQVELAKAKSAAKLDELHAAGEEDRLTSQVKNDGSIDVSYAKALLDALKAQGQMTGVKWLDALNQSVRPVITYWWCLVLYTAAKVIAIIVAFQSKVQLAGFEQILVTEFDRAVIGSILGFWFVDRALRKMGRG